MNFAANTAFNKIARSCLRRPRMGGPHIDIDRRVDDGFVSSRTVPTAPLGVPLRGLEQPEMVGDGSRFAA